MSLWRRMRGELAGAWRSVRYDLRGRPDSADVTSTGLSTFPGSLMEWRTAPPETDARPPRRFVAVTALCLLALAGAIGSYLLVTRGLAAAGDQPLAAPAAEMPASAPRTGAPGEPETGAPEEPDDAIGPPSPTRTTPPVPGTTHATGAAVPVATGAGTSGIGTRRPPARHRPAATPECHCVTPPVPTPTAPSPSSGRTPGPAGSPSGSPAATPGGSAEPSASPSDPGADAGHRRDRRHWKKHG
ncbi:hypothetical protein Acy02nite_11410 [Actinoplanes cyaneus]|uniref:Uncharacterized protein n=1 Tax=Actinoplanes cyaneus TaxID=52696 RepID=A0A919LYQ6_9ACTN|nr:hypothetical protein [Actinoplanes cyaneus]MCW2137208.1 hypothetical protein [Actinoplanes cyaneus]GID63260.1 hypothetical protein Acy02nite_11410 [Actinoplanes cyaneus]